MGADEPLGARHQRSPFHWNCKNASVDTWGAKKQLERDRTRYPIPYGEFHLRYPPAFLSHGPKCAPGKPAALFARSRGLRADGRMRTRFVAPDRRDPQARRIAEILC